MEKNKPIIVALGPTASGKTELAVALARLIQGKFIEALPLVLGKIWMYIKMGESWSNII